MILSVAPLDTILTPTVVLALFTVPLTVFQSESSVKLTSIVEDKLQVEPSVVVSTEKFVSGLASHLLT